MEEKFMIRDQYGDMIDVLSGDMEHYGMTAQEAFDSFLSDFDDPPEYELVHVQINVIGGNRA